MSQLDIGIVVAYLVITLAIGLWAGKGVNTVKQYAIGSKNYGTFIIVATLFATNVGGGSTIGTTEKVLTVGVMYALITLGMPVNKFVTAYCVAPFMNRFRNKISIGEIMHTCYGKPGQVITGIMGTLLAIGIVGGQIGALGYVGNYFWGLDRLYSTLIAAGIVVIYSSIGGVRAVAFTDVFQFAIALYVIPMIYYESSWRIGGIGQLWKQVPAEKLQLATNWQDWIIYISLFLAYCTPSLEPSFTQRLLMARDAIQAQNTMKSLIWADVLFFAAITCIAFSSSVLAPDVNPNHAFFHILQTVLSEGWKGIAVAGVLAFIMSTADSDLNAASVCLIHDTVQPLKREPLAASAELKWLRVATVATGTLAIVAALSFQSLIDLMWSVYDLWAPCIVIPLFACVMGYKSSIRAFSFAVATGFLCTTAWKLWGPTWIRSMLPGMMANFIAFYIARYFDKPEDIYWDESEFDPTIPAQKRKWKRQWEQKHGKVSQMPEDQEQTKEEQE
ncbi:MAG: sodium:solute symporter family protein [Myxococcota bacterium]